MIAMRLNATLNAREPARADHRYRLHFMLKFKG